MDARFAACEVVVRWSPSCAKLMAMAGLWNIHIHYDALPDSRVPLEAQRVLDVGTGDGFLAARLAR
jgi:protein-L-isoaspartate O-methyltransferase